MQTIKLVNGMEVSRFSLGTWGFSGAAVWGDNDDAISIRTIHEALDNGINLLDTAPVYGDGKAEEVLGRALKGRRDKAIVSTKAFMGDLSYDGVLRQCEESLKRLDTDHVDLYLIHWPNPEFPADETMKAFEKLKSDGKIRGIAVCNYGKGALEGVSGHEITLNQLPYSLIWRQIEKKTAPVCAENSIALWAYSPLAQGLLTGKYKSLDDVPMNRRTTRFYDSRWGQSRHTDTGFEADIFAFLAKLETLCKRTGFSIPELAIAFLKTRPNMGSILIGSRTPEQLRENIKSFETNIPTELITELTTLSDPLLELMGENADMWSNKNNGRIY